MDFKFTEEQKMLRASVEDVFKKEFSRQYLREVDERDEFPFEIYNKIAELGWLALPFPEEYGGSNGNYIDFTVILEVLARESMCAASIYLLNVGFGGTTLLRWGTEEQKKLYLPGLIEGKIKFCLCATEPNAGSDVAAAVTAAVPSRDGYVINGSKTFSSSAQVADRLLVLTRTDKTVSKHKGLSIFIVDRNSPGLEIHPFQVLGVRGCGANDVYLQDVYVPSDHLLGGELNQGWAQINDIFAIERLSLSALCVGNMQRVLDDALDYAKHREQFGQPIGKFQAIRHLLAEIYIQSEAACLLTYRLAWLLTEGLEYLAEASAAKVFCSEAFVDVANKGLQVMGGAGYTMEYDMQRYFRDARMFPIGGGTTQIQKDIIAKSLEL